MDIEAKKSGDSDLLNQKTQIISEKETEIKNLQDKLKVTTIYSKQFKLMYVLIPNYNRILRKAIKRWSTQ